MLRPFENRVRYCRTNPGPLGTVGAGNPLCRGTVSVVYPVLSLTEAQTDASLLQEFFKGSKMH